MWRTTVHSSASRKTNTCRGLNWSVQEKLHTRCRIRVLEWRTGAIMNPWTVKRIREFINYHSRTLEFKVLSHLEIKVEYLYLFSATMVSAVQTHFELGVQISCSCTECHALLINFQCASESSTLETKI